MGTEPKHETVREETAQDRALLRHCIAVLAYRGSKPLREATPEFVTYDTGEGRTPLHILSHVSDLMHWALTLASGEGQGKNSTPGSWQDEVNRFYSSLAALDEYLASNAPMRAEIPRLLAGPVADALTHVGQLTLLRRMAGTPTIGENYFAADIETGRVGPDQSPAVKPFRTG